MKILRLMKEMPRVYAAGQDLRWGVRLVVGFGSKIWLFCVPPDGLYAKTDANPIEIQGVEIGQVENLVDVAVDSSMGALLIWAFTSNGMAYTWHIEDRGDQRVIKRSVLRDGLVVDQYDADGDVIMRDAPPLRTEGAASLESRESQMSPSGSFQSRFIETSRELGMTDLDEGYFSDNEHAGVILKADILHYSL